MAMISDGFRISIDMPQELQTQSVWNKITSLRSSQKGFLIAMGVNSIFAASLAILEFFEPDPPPDSLLPWFVDSSVVAKNTYKWSFLIDCLLTTSITALCVNIFLQKNQQQDENNITPEMTAIIQKRVEEEIQKLTSEINNLPT